MVKYVHMVMTTGEIGPTFVQTGDGGTFDELQL